MDASKDEGTANGLSGPRPRALILSLSKDETAASPPLSSRPLPLRSLCEPLRSQRNLGPLPQLSASSSANWAWPWPGNVSQSG